MGPDRYYPVETPELLFVCQDCTTVAIHDCRWPHCPRDHRVMVADTLDHDRWHLEQAVHQDPNQGRLL
jgi:hypothetical protein